MRHPKSQWFLKLGIPFSWVILEAVDRWGSLLFWIIPHLWASRWSPNFRWFPNIKSHYISLHFRYISEPQVVTLHRRGEQLQRLVKDPYSSNVCISENQKHGGTSQSENVWKMKGTTPNLMFVHQIFLVSEPFWRVYPSHFQTDPIDHSSKSPSVEECRGFFYPIYWRLSSSMDSEPQPTSTKGWQRVFSTALSPLISCRLVGSISADHWDAIGLSWGNEMAIQYRASRGGSFPD